MTEVRFTKDTPYVIKGSPPMETPDGKTREIPEGASLCRCGRSSSKPYCDGTHVDIGFTGDKLPGRLPDRDRRYKGRELTIIDNRGVCSHDESCIRGLPDVFRRDRFPWIDPNAASAEEIIRVIELCPSGALSWEVDGVRHQDLDREPRIIVMPGGPFHFVGGIAMTDDLGSAPESTEHFTLCRCGESKNKPFCDGGHHQVHFDRDW